ncbi:MAG: four helix bundle protein [Candidatus Nealsonbacteria bacterium DGGOD1a]|jgi:S23 ribosomal protein.|nr:MAG: four helix bundle protein [Candidatus Nealsonbacteria bacterium DGGOD1a]
METNSNYGFKFRNWDIYNDARKFRNLIYETTNKFPKDERFGLTDQLRRASVSIILNIAEGANKNTDKDRRVYINRAHCSLDEVVAGIDCAVDESFIDETTRIKILENASSLAKRLRAFTNYLHREP